MSFATERQPRRKFLGYLGIGLGGLGFLSGASALESGGPHNILSSTHLDAAVDSPILGDLMTGESVPSPLNWRRLPIGVSDTVLRSSGGRPQWLAGVTNGAHMEATVPTNSPITAVADAQAGINLGAGRSTFNQAILYDAVAQVRTVANTALIWTGEVHDPGHQILDTFFIQFPATGAGDIFDMTVPIKGLDITPVDGSYHINTLTLTLNGGTVTIINRILLGRAV